MRIESISLLGCRELAQVDWPSLSPRLATVVGPNPQSSALRDSLSLLFASFSQVKVHDLLTKWGWDDNPEVLGDDLPEQVVFKSKERASFLIDDDQPRRIQIDLSIALDAEQLGYLRGALSREPQLLQALLLDPKLFFRWSALFNKGLSAVAFHVSTIRLGAQALESGTHPAWLKVLLGQFSQRFCSLSCFDDAAGLAAQMALSLTQPQAYTAFVESLSGIGSIRAARDMDGRPLLLLDERPLSQWNVSQMVNQAAAIHLTQSEIVWIDGPLLVEANDAVQIINSHQQGDFHLDAIEKPPTLTFSAKS